MDQDPLKLCEPSQIFLQLFLSEMVITAVQVTNAGASPWGNHLKTVHPRIRDLCPAADLLVPEPLAVL